MKRFLVIAATLAAVEACSKKTITSTSTVVGASGGTVPGPTGGPSLQIPPSALPANVTVTVAKSPGPPPAAALSPLYVFGPEGTVFAKPVTISFPAPSGVTDASVYWTKLGSSTVYDSLPATISGGTVSADVTHFSGGCVGVRCTQGQTCPSTNPCHTAAEDCSTGTRVCADTGNEPNGTICGTNQVCTAGACSACTPGATCTSSNPCHTAAQDCSTGAACNDNGNKPDGTSCGGSNVCTAGACGPPPAGCTAGLVCTPTGAADPCKTYATSCSGGVSSCVASGNSSDGTDCGTFSIAGTWSGNETDTVCDAPNAQTNICSPLVLTLTQSGSSISGSATCSGQGPYSLTGSVSGNTATINLAPSSCYGSGQGNLTFTCTASNDTTLNCTASGTDCACCEPKGSPTCPADETSHPTTGSGTLTRPSDRVCSGGSCITACVAGSTDANCPPASPAPCKTYAYACNSTLTTSTCAASDTATGTSCGTNQVCHSGGCVSSRTVTGQLTTIFEDDNGGLTTVNGWPAEQGGALPTAIDVSDTSDAGYQSYPITLDADAAFAVPNVPTGTYFLQMDTPFTTTLSDGGPVSVVSRSLNEATTSKLDLSVLIAGRPDRAPPDAGTPVQLELSGLQPWAPGMLLRLSSSQASELTRIVKQEMDVPPVNGDTAIDAGIDWSNTDPPQYLPDATKGDVTWIYQRANHDITGTSVAGTITASLADMVTYAKLTDLTIANRTGGTIAAVMSPVPQTGSMPGDWRFSQFAALATQINPNATASSVTGANSFPGIAVLPVVQSLTFPNEPLNGALARGAFIISIPTATDDVDFGTIPFGKFLDSLWLYDAQWIYSYDVPLTAPGGSAPLTTIQDSYLFEVPLDSLPSSIVPKLSPPTAVQLNGANAFTPATGVGTQPTISWSAPTLGTVTHYNVSVAPVNVDFQPGELASISAMLFDATSWRVPAGFMKSGRFYSGNVGAANLAGEALDTAPFRMGVPLYSVGCDFGLFTP